MDWPALALQQVQTAINTLQTSFQRKLSVILTHEAGVGYKGLGEDRPAGRVQGILKEENMTESSFETHEALRTLQHAGFEAAQAQAVVDVVTRAPISTQVVKDLERIKVQVETNMATEDRALVAVLEPISPTWWPSWKRTWPPRPTRGPAGIPLPSAVATRRGLRRADHRACRAGCSRVVAILQTSHIPAALE